MFKSLRRLQLKRRGLMTEKTRRKQSEREWVERFRESGVVRALSLLLFASGLAVLIIGAADSCEGVFGARWRAFAISGVVLIAAVAHFYLNHPVSFRRNSRVVLIFGMMFAQLALMRLVSGLADGGAFGADGGRYAFLLAPYALAPMAITVLMGRNHGLFVTVLCSVWGTMLVDAALALPAMMAGLVVGFVAVLVTDGVRKRSRLVRAGVMIGLAVMLLGLLFGQIGGDLGDLGNPGNPGNPEGVDWRALGYGLLAALAGGVATATVVGGLLPVLESLFRITTEISWIELADLNHPLLRRMTLEAPGTYHHSLVVANLAEAAAEEIGANATMCRVCSYFHDIGKLVKPEYFIENIGEGDNPHDDLTPTMSALVITAHVKEGVDIALKNKLNSDIIDIIEQHHGTSLVYFFYRRALDQQEEVRKQVEEGNANEDDVPEVAEKSFRYPGMRPQFKESGIVSIADAVEGASRTLQKPTPGKIRQLVDEIIHARIRDGQLAECDLTLRELGVIADSFNATLRSMLHSRITYPKDDSDLEKHGGKKKPRKKNGSISGKLSSKSGKKTGALLP